MSRLPTPTLAEVIRSSIAASAADLHVAIPAVVERVDLAKGLVDARPLVKDLVGDRDDKLTALPMPVITNVPVVWPGAGGFRLTFPIAKGDTVLLVFADRSLDAWLATGGEVDPADPRRHALSDAIAIPGLRDFKTPWTGAATGGVTLGQDGGTYQKVALGEALRTELDAIWNVLTKHQHDVVGVTAGTATVAATPAGATGAIPSAAAKDATAPLRTPSKQTVTSDTVKVST